MNSRPLTLDVGAALRPISGETISGDAYEVFESPGRLVVTLADGLGHGARAAVAAQSFLRVIGEHREATVDEMFKEGHRALLRSRGVVAAIAVFDRADASLEVAIVGNISCSLYRAGRATHFVPIAGVLGSAYRRTRSERATLTPRDLFVMHSDGVRTRHGIDPARDFTTSAACAASLLDACGKSHDDQSVVVVAASQGDHATARASVERVELPIRSDTDAATGATLARAFAAQVGLPVRAQWEVGIAVAELVTNVVKYAGRGDLQLQLRDASTLEVVVRDSGGGIADVAAAKRDGVSNGRRLFAPKGDGPERVGLGVGLGSVHRMMDTVAIDTDAAGTTVVATKRFDAPARA